MSKTEIINEEPNFDEPDSSNKRRSIFWQTN